MNCWIAEIGLASPQLCVYRADGQPDAAHLGFSENWLSKSATGPHLSKEEANDPRLLKPICRKHHGMLDNGSLSVLRSQLPASVEEYAEEFGLGYKLDRDYGPI